MVNIAGIFHSTASSFIHWILSPQDCATQCHSLSNQNSGAQTVHRKFVALRALNRTKDRVRLADPRRRDSMEGSTFALRQWLANSLPYHLLEFDGEYPPVSVLGLEKRTLDALSDNIFEFLWHTSYNCRKNLDQTVFVAVFYASSLMPKGMLSSRELYSAHGVLVATRLFVVTFVLATKCFNDSHAKCLNKIVSHSNPNLTASSAISLEFSALEVLGFRIFMQHGIWIQHLKEILVWTVEYFPDGHLHIRERLTRFLADSNASIVVGQPEFQPLNISPSSHSIMKLQNKLLAGLEKKL